MKIFDVQIDELSKLDAIRALDSKQVIFTPNPEILLEARKNIEFKKALDKGSLMLADGHGLLFVSTLLKFPKILRLLLYLPALGLFLLWKRPFKYIFPEVMHGSDFMALVVSWAEVNNKSVFFLGGKAGVAKKCADYFASQHKDLKIAGYSDSDPGEKAFNLVKKSETDVLFVAYGAPKQEIWIANYADKLKLHIAMGVGGSFDFWSGEISRAPSFMRKLGLEWVWRLLKNPWSRGIRIWNAFVKFPLTSLFSS